MYNAIVSLVLRIVLVKFNFICSGEKDDPAIVPDPAEATAANPRSAPVVVPLSLLLVKIVGSSGPSAPLN